MLYPGLGLGTIVSRSRLISVGMLAAAANALSSLVAVRLPGRVAASAYRRLAQRDGDGCGSGGGGSGSGGLGRRQTRGHRSTGGRRDVAAGVSPDPGILTAAAENEGLGQKNIAEAGPEVDPACTLRRRNLDAGLLRVRSGGRLDVPASGDAKPRTPEYRAASFDTVTRALAKFGSAPPVIGPDGLIGRIEIQRLGVSVVVVEGTGEPRCGARPGILPARGCRDKPATRNRRAPRHVFPALAQYPARRHHHAHHAARRVPLPRRVDQGGEPS